MYFHPGMNEISYDVNGLPVAWLQSFTETREQLRHFAHLTPYPDAWPHVRIRGTSAFGLNCTEIYLGAPREEAPVLRVMYYLSPLPLRNADDLHSPYVEHMERVLGPAAKKKDHYQSAMWQGRLSSGSVVYTAEWATPKVRITLSVFGGQRDTDSGIQAACLFVYWIDERAAAKPFLAQREHDATELQRHLTPGIVVQKFMLNDVQRPWHIAHHENAQPHEALYDIELRKAQLALYRPGRFALPVHLSAELDEKELWVFRIDALKRTYICNKWDCTFINDNESCEFRFIDLLPARGPGERQLEVSDFGASDAPGSDTLLDAAHWIEQLSGLKLTMIEYPDA